MPGNAQRVLVVGATSKIAEEVARRYAAAGSHLFLAARNSDRLQTIADDLRVRGAAAVDYLIFDAEQMREPVVARAFQALGGIDIAILAHGVLPDQEQCEKDFARAEHVYRVNFLSMVALLTELSHICETGSAIAVIGSVAGDRMRRKNYLYGSSKAALHCYLDGLRQQLQPQGVHLLLVKPGFVDTPMTAHLRKTPLYASAEHVAQDITRALANKRAVLYTPWFWRWIMVVIKALPAWLMKRLPF